jgi:thiol-disulfide isomerase/thioredoxin
LLAPPALAADLLPFTDAPKPSLRLERLGGGERLAPPDGTGIVIVHFFATWCPPCVPELAALDRMARARPDIDVVAIDVGEVAARVGRFLETRPVAFPVLLDPDLAAARAWGVAGLPASFVFAGPGAPIRAADGDVDWDAPATRDLLDHLIETAPRNGVPDGEKQDEPT